MWWWFSRSKTREPEETTEGSTSQDVATPHTPANRLLNLQRSAGNRAAQRIIKEERLETASNSVGEPLDEATRSSMEPRFGVDLAKVRVHTDEKASKSAETFDAQAYTSGRDIYFGAGKYAPGTTEGQRLLAHELTHVVQQTAAGEETTTHGPAKLVPPDDRTEQEADRVAHQVVAGGTEPVTIEQGGIALSPTVQRAALVDKDYEALAEQLNKAMAGWGTDEEAIFVALQKLEKDATAITKLKDVYKKKYSADLEGEIRSEMSGSELGFALELLGIASKRKEEQVAAAPPAADAEYKSVAAQLYAAMKGPGTDEEAIYAALVPFKRDEAKLTKLKDTYQKEYSGGLTGKGLEEDIKDEMSSDELAYALYLLNAPPPATTPTAEATVVGAGTEEHKATAGGGEVSVRTGVDYTPAGGGATRVGGFAIGYEGGLAAESRWLQFIWSEVLATQPDGSVKYVAESGLPTSNGTMELTTNTSAPIYKVDSGTASSPFYEEGFRDIRTATGTTIYDRPAEFTDVIHRQFDAGATKVVERDHFDTFLVRDYKTIYRVSVVVEWVYTSKMSVTRTTKFSSGAQVDDLPAAMRKQLIKEYPKFEYIR